MDSYYFPGVANNFSCSISSFYVVELSGENVVIAHVYFKTKLQTKRTRSVIFNIFLLYNIFLVKLKPPGATLTFYFMFFLGGGKGKRTREEKSLMRIYFLFIQILCQKVQYTLNLINYIRKGKRFSWRKTCVNVKTSWNSLFVAYKNFRVS